jgi:hypothetical protein
MATPFTAPVYVLLVIGFACTGLFSATPMRSIIQAIVDHCNPAYDRWRPADVLGIDSTFVVPRNVDTVMTFGTFLVSVTLLVTSSWMIDFRVRAGV